MIKDILIQAMLFGFIVSSLLVLWAIAITPFIREAFRKHPRREAVIIPFARPDRRGGRHG
jgi:hypothetical protein